MFIVICHKRENLDSDFSHFLAEHVLEIGLPWQQLSPGDQKVHQMMCNRLTIKVTKFQQSRTNHFLTVAKKPPGRANLPPYKIGLSVML